MNGRKLSGRDIATMVVSVIAIALVVLVIMKMTEQKNTPSENEANKTTIVVKSTVNANGEIEYVTMIEEYTDSGLHASVSYKPKTTEPTEDEESTGEDESETENDIIYETDANGERVTDANGEPVTKHSEPATGEEPATDANGDPVTDPEQSSAQSTEPETEESTTTPLNDENYIADTSAAYNVADVINSARNGSELDSLKFDNALSATARSYSLYRAFPNSRSFGGAGGTVITYDTEGVSGIARAVMAQSDVASGEYHRIGVGIIRYQGKSYTTVILL